MLHHLIPADSGWLGTVAKIDVVGDRTHVLITNAILPAPNFWGKTKDKKLTKLVIRCWQQLDQLNFKTGDIIRCYAIDVDAYDLVNRCDSGENRSHGTFTVLKPAARGSPMPIKFTKAVVMDNKIIVHVNDGKQITMSVTADRIYLSVSGLGVDGVLRPEQVSANGVDIRYDKQIPASAII